MAAYISSTVKFQFNTSLILHKPEKNTWPMEK